jgi:hypothetical protein
MASAFEHDCLEIPATVVARNPYRVMSSTFVTTFRTLKFRRITLNQKASAA